MLIKRIIIGYSLCLRRTGQEVNALNCHRRNLGCFRKNFLARKGVKCLYLVVEHPSLEVLKTRLDKHVPGMV